MSKNTNETLYSTEKIHQIDENKILDDALSSLKGAAIRFSIDAISDANVRASYTKNINRITLDIKDLVKTNKTTIEEAVAFSYEMRNKILVEHRKYTSIQGLAKAQQYKKTPPSLNELLDRYSQKKFNSNFNILTKEQKTSTYYEIIEASGRDNTKFTTRNQRLKTIGKVGILVTATLATFEIINADNKQKETVKQGIQIGAGAAGGWLAGFSVTPLCGPGAPFCAIAIILLGSAAGGLIGSKVADTLDSEIEEFTKWKLL